MYIALAGSMPASGGSFPLIGNRPIIPRPHKTDSPTVSARKSVGQIYTEPRVVCVPAADSNASAQAADFRAIEDSEGNLYVLWTENASDEEGSAAREIFGTGLVGYETAVIDEDGNAGTARASSGWSKSQTKRLILRFRNWMRMTSTKLPEGDCSTMYLRLMKNPTIRTTKTGTDRWGSCPLTA